MTRWDGTKLHLFIAKFSNLYDDGSPPRIHNFFRTRVYVEISSVFYTSVPSISIKRTMPVRLLTDSEEKGCRRNRIGWRDG